MERKEEKVTRKMVATKETMISNLKTEKMAQCFTLNASQDTAEFSAQLANQELTNMITHSENVLCAKINLSILIIKVMEGALHFANTNVNLAVSHRQPILTAWTL